MEGGKRFKIKKNKGATTLVDLTHLQLSVYTGKAAQGLDCYCYSSEGQEVKEKEKRWPQPKGSWPSADPDTVGSPENGYESSRKD